MKTFAQFLIDEGLASEENVVSALLLQSEGLPSLASALASMQIYSHEQMLEIFAYQAVHVTEFKTAAIALGLWDEATLGKRLEEFYASKVRPLGDILLERGSITLEQLADGLSRYVKEFGESCLGASRSPSQKAPAADRRLRDLYCQYFNEERRVRLRACLERLNNKDRETLSREIRTLRTAAHMILADLSVQLADGMLKALEHSAPADGLLPKAFDILWRLRETLAVGGTEADFLANGTQESAIESVCQDLNGMGEAA